MDGYFGYVIEMPKIYPIYQKVVRIKEVFESITNYIKTGTYSQLILTHIYLMHNV